MTVTLAFYKDGKSGVSRFIRWVTRSPHYSHVEIIMGTVWVTALIGQGVVARRYVPEDHKEKYDYIDVEVSEKHWHETIEYVNKINEDNMYDYLGALFGSMLNIPFIQDPNKFFCSEVVTNILKRLDEPKARTLSGSRNTPQIIYDLYKDK